jgi:membrane-bound lytic murein transglycosylase F
MIFENHKKNHLTHATQQLWQITQKTFFRAAMLMMALSACEQQQQQQQPVEEIVDLPQMRERKTLMVATCDNVVNYFVYRGEPMGFHFDVLAELGKHLGLKVEFLIGKSHAENLQCLAKRQCDLVASGWLPAKDDMPATGVDTLYMAQQALVQRKPDGWKKMTACEQEESLIRLPETLNGKTVYA